MQTLVDVIVAAPLGFVLGLVAGLRLAYLRRRAEPAEVRVVIEQRDYSHERPAP